MQFSTGFLPYHEAVHMFLKTMNVIDSIGFTTNRCRVKTSIRLNESELDLSNKMDKLNRFKYLLSLNEKQLFEWWPQSETDQKLVYQNHKQYIRPRQMYSVVLNESFLERMDQNNFIFPQSDFFANDFSELGNGVLSFNYISGKDYTKKKKESINTINAIIEHTYETLANNRTYTNQERIKIGSIVSEFKKAVDSTRTYEKFKSNYPEIQLYIDLKSDSRIIEANYQKIRDKIFELIVSGGIEEASLNYDTIRHRFQVKDANLKRAILIENVEFFDCTLEGELSKCLFRNCIIKNSNLTECEIFSSNLIKFSKLIDCEYSGDLNEVSSSYLDNSENKVINAELRECLVNRGRMSPGSQIDKTTKIIN
jgi:ribosome-associated toxin RatA of RatAB toxin-antitoxin module